MAAARRGGADGSGTGVRDPQRDRTDTSLKVERSTADDRKLDERSRLANERESTDRDLSGERTDSDKLQVDLREANERMVTAAIAAHEESEAADAARQRAEESERALREVAEFRELFIGILGHDLRNPLSSISAAAATMLRRGHLDEPDAKTAARIIRSGQRMSALITQLLDLTRARLGGGLVVEQKPGDLGDVCRDVIEEFEDAVIDLQLEGDLTGSWDTDRLAQVLSNLVGNAVQYSQKGTPVNVRVYPDGSEVVLEVSNHGEPIPPEVLAHLFEPFRRGQPHRKSPSGNLGLGLYIAHQIVLAHGGTLEARSAGDTTVFAARLPRVPRRA